MFNRRQRQIVTRGCAEKILNLSILCRKRKGSSQPSASLAHTSQAQRVPGCWGSSRLARMGVRGLWAGYSCKITSFGHVAWVLANLWALTRRFTISSCSGGAGRKEIRVRMAKEGGELQEQGFMMFEKWGEKKAGTYICVNDIFISWFCHGFIVRHEGQVVQLCVKAQELQGLSKSSSAKEGSQNNSFSCQMSMTVPNSFLGT